MNIKDFEKVSVVIPLHYNDGESTTMTSSLVEVSREGEINIKIRGVKHAQAFMALILSQQIIGFTTNQQPAVHGIPGHNVEVVETDPKSASFKFENPDSCGNHDPIQHRDTYEAWCLRCGKNRFGEPPRNILFNNRPSRIGESLRTYEERTTSEGS